MIDVCLLFFTEASFAEEVSQRGMLKPLSARLVGISVLIKRVEWEAVEIKAMDLAECERQGREVQAV